MFAVEILGVSSDRRRPRGGGGKPPSSGRSRAEWPRPAGQAFLTEMSQSCRGVRIRLDFCRKGRIAMCVGRWIWLRGLAPRPAGLWVVRASIPAPRTNGAQTHVDPFPREVPEPQERRTKEEERQIERDISAQGHVRRGHR